MSSSISARRGVPAALTALAVAVLFLVGFTQGSAHAAETTGSATITLNTAKTGKAFAISPAKGKRVGKKGIRAKAPVKSLFVGNTSSINLGGGIKLANGKRSVKITGLKLNIRNNLTVVRGRIGKANVVVFNARGRATTKTSQTIKTARINGAKLTFTAKTAKRVKQKLKLSKAPTGRIGSLSVFAKKTTPIVDPCLADPNAEGCNPDPCEVNPNAEGCNPDPCIANPDGEGCPITDPYLAQCNVAATSKVTGSLPAPAALPTLTSPQAITELTTVSWGIKTSFRNYVVSPATNGSIHASDGATATGTAPAYSGFDWTFVDGQFADNGTPNDPADDQAILNLNGTVVLCATDHNFRVVISDPTVVIDGLDSRIIADVDSNLDGSWIPAQRIDLATLDLSGVTSEALDTALGTKWANVPAALTESGGKAICGDGEPLCPYTSGTAMDPITIEAPVGELVDQYNAECGVPVANRVDDAWTPAAPLPSMTDTLPITEPDSIDWGFLSSFRGYVFGAPPAGTLQALDGASRAPGMDPTRGFTFPVEGGSYAANDSADNADDQAVINGEGTALFCKAGHGLWLSITNPTIIIDGENSRIAATISENSNGTNDSGPWKTAQRVDLAELDLSGITPTYNKSGSEVTWGSVPATLAAGAASVVNGTYPAGTALDPVTVSVQTAYDTGAGDAAAWDALATYVSTNLPFPNNDPAAGGCEVGVPTQAVVPTAGNARTIDEHVALGGTTSTWSPTPNPATVAPTLTGTAVTGGNFNWGFRRSLRASLNSTGNFNAVGGAVASDPVYYGEGGTLGQRGPGVFTPGNMGDAADYFTWPTASGTYDANGAGDADDQLVMRTEGTVAFCQTQSAQRYGIIFANPTVIIDGANSRITIDVAVRYRLSWAWATVDFASLDLSDPGFVFNSTTDSGTVTKTWTFPDAVSNVGPVELTADGEKMAKMLSSAYVAGLGLDGTTIRASFPE